MATGKNLTLLGVVGRAQGKHLQSVALMMRSDGEQFGVVSFARGRAFDAYAVRCHAIGEVKSQVPIATVHGMATRAGAEMAITQQLLDGTR